MILKARIREKATNAAFIGLVYVIASLYALTAEAQSLNNVNFTGDNVTAFVKTSGRPVPLSTSVNPGAQANPLNNLINSSYEELKPVLTPCGKRLYFSRPVNPNNPEGLNDPEAIWYTEYNSQTQLWSQPIHLTGMLNNAGPNFVNNVSPTGDTLILGNQYGKKGKMRAGLSYSINKNGAWSEPMAISIRNDYNMSAHANAFVSLKNGIIIQAIERAETYGDRDLYVSFWNGEEASEPVNMGAIINSELEESSPFLSADTKTLYFASKGHHGYGGYDIYMTTRLDDSWTNWSQPENLGPAVNGNLDDQFFSITHCGNFAIFSKQVSVHNTDIFRIATEDLFGPTTALQQISRQKVALAGL